MISIHNIYNTTKTSRYYSPTCIIQEEGLHKNIKSFLAKDVPLYLIYDSYFPSDFVKIETNYCFAVTKETCEDEVMAALKLRPNGEFQILAFGGGSTIDLAKAIIAFQNFGVWRQLGYGDYRYVCDNAPTRSMRFIAVPTTPATGSEVSRYYLVKDGISGRKIVSRSWGICPDIALLDPLLLKSIKCVDLIPFAFDAFTHAWETYFCRQERTSLICTIGADAMNKILIAVFEIICSKGISCSKIAELQMAASQGGVCLSNVRTGLIHTAGEALAAEMSIAHPRSLWIFFEAIIEFYSLEIDEQFQLLVKNFRIPIKNTSDVIQFWKKAWNIWDSKYKNHSNTNNKVSISSLRENIIKDQVLMNKEFPKKISNHDIDMLLIKALRNSGIPFM